MSATGRQSVSDGAAKAHGAAMVERGPQVGRSASMGYLEGLLRKVFAEQGAMDAADLARRSVASFELSRRDAEIFELRATMSERAAAERFGLGARHVRKIVNHRTEICQSKS